jgi:hypothetical protein
VLLLAGSLRVLTLPGPPDEECPPGLRGRGAPLEEQPGDWCVRPRDAELEQLAMDSWAPQSGFAAAIRLTRDLISALTGDRRSIGTRVWSGIRGSDGAATARWCRESQ